MSQAWPDWRGETAVIVASGPSASSVPLEGCRGLAKFIAVNNSWQLVSWADVLYAADHQWWDWHHGVSAFQGLKLTGDFRCVVKFPNVGLVTVATGKHEILTDVRGRIGHGGNSGFQALNLAVQFGARRVVLVGFDMTVARGIHWHGKHAGLGRRNPDERMIAKWRAVLDGAAPRLKALGVEVLNASAVSSLTAYPKVSLSDVFENRADAIAA